MLSDETFPDELNFEEENENYESIKSTKSLENINSFFSPENSNSSNNSTEINKSMIDSINIERLISSSDLPKLTRSLIDTEKKLQQQHPETDEASFKSIEKSAINCKPPPPTAPIKKRKSYSCHDLQLRKNSSNNYDHVESKVKKLIENLRDDRRKKTFSRTKSMPVCTVQTTTIDVTKQNGSNTKNVPSEQDLRREIRKKCIKIYELEEICETKDAKILELQFEKAKMKMQFDEFRYEIEKLKEIEAKYKQMKVFTPDRALKSVLIQTEIDQHPSLSSLVADTSRQLLLGDSSERPIYKANNYVYEPVVRHLTFNEGSTYFSAINNTSLDNLIPLESDITVEGMDEETRNGDNNSFNEIAVTPDSPDNETDKKKKVIKKKKFRFLKLMQCISGKH